jgi:phosphoribosylformimino-5-aminoimidazole carboxamide ribotide isomerase
MVKAVGIEVIASGGVSNLEDIRHLKEVGVSGAIVGKALYTKDLDLKEAIEIAK